MPATQTKPALPPLTDTQEAGLRDAFKVLYTHFATYGTTVLPTFDSLSPDGYEILAQRAIVAHKTMLKNRREEALRQVREAVKGVIAPYIETARREKEAFDTLLASTPEAMRSYIKPFADHTVVPFTEVSAVFPQGSKSEQIVVALKDLGYIVAKGTEGYYVKVQLPFMAKAAK